MEEGVRSKAFPQTHTSVKKELSGTVVVVYKVDLPIRR